MDFMAPKVGIHRRHFSIPHPYPQLLLSESIVKNWKNIEAQYAKSRASISIPELDPTGVRSIIYLNKFEKFREACIKGSAHKRYELHLDIAKYFYSVYTHSIPWAIHTKAQAKADHSSRLWGNDIDKFMRLAQSNQTKGMPVGTDKSRIVAEIIGCEIDLRFEETLKQYALDGVGYRFVDDCHYFFDSLADAELALREYQKILMGYGLKLNDEKTTIKERPCSFDETWKSPLNNFVIEPVLDKKQRIHLKDYFNLLLSTAIAYPKGSVIKYGIKRLLKQNIHRNNIDIFEPLLFTIAISESSILPDVLQLLNKYRSVLSPNGVSEFVLSVIANNVHKGHHFEVSWGLWIAKCFNVVIPRELAQDIIDSRDAISIIILLDLRASKLALTRLGLQDLIDDLDNDSLSGDKWLLAYEAELNGWLKLNNISSNPFFDLLRNRKISFYDQSAGSYVKPSTPSTNSAITRPKIKLIAPSNSSNEY
jgi:hypothetical protein